MDEYEGEEWKGWRMEEGETPYTPSTMKVFRESGQYVNWATEWYIQR